MVARIGWGWRLAALIAAGLSILSRPAGCQTPLPDELRRWSELRLDGLGRAVQGLTLSAGHLTVVLTTGHAARVLAGDEVIGIFVRGEGTLEYTSADPIEFPVVRNNVRHATGLKPLDPNGQPVVRDRFNELLWLAADAPLPALPAAKLLTALDDAFADHVKKFAMVHSSPASHEFAARRLNGVGQPFVRAEFTGGAEDLLYEFDPGESKSESLAALRRSSWVSHRYDLDWISDQPLGRDRRDPIVPRFILTDVDLAVTASVSKDVSISATETLVGVGADSRLLTLDLVDTVYARSAGDERHLRVKGVFDAAGNAVPFDHRSDEIVVALASPLARGRSMTLRFEMEGDILHSPRGDSDWELGVWPWFPQPDLSGQYYKVHTVVKVRKPFVPFAPGKTIRRVEEGEYNLLETRVDKPVQFMVLVAGRYEWVEDTKDGVTVRVASYAGKSPNLKRVLKLAHEMIAFYEPFLGPFPFDEFNIVEINQWGWGQAPPAFMFITSEAFNPLGGEINKLFSKGINERLAHEIAHQYWGHVVKMPSYEEQWLTESFAEMSAGLLIRQLMGKSDFEGLANYWRGRAEEAAAVAPIPLANEIENDANEIDRWYQRTYLLYAKGPSLLNSIRLEIGDDQFLRFLRSCQATFGWKFGSTKMVEAVLDKLTGKDWKPFFDAYYWGTALPPR